MNKEKFNKDMKVSSTTLNNLELITLLENLTGIELKLYLFQLATRNNLVTPLKREDILRLTGLSKSSYYNAVNSLRKKGILLE